MMSDEIKLQLLVDPELPAVLQDVVCFESGATPEQTRDPSLWTYNHHGEGFTSQSPGALTRLFEDLVSGRPFPITLGLRKVGGVDSIIAAALFLHRDLALHSTTPGLVALVDLVHRQGPTFYAHFEDDVARFLRGLEDFFPFGLSKQEYGERLGTSVQWVRDLVLDNTLPNFGLPRPSVRILEVGTRGFVVADTDRPSIEAWMPLFRQGHLRGLLLGPIDGDHRQVLIARKSPQVGFDLEQAALHLNEMEVLSGGERDWVVEGNFLRSPTGGSLLLVGLLLDLLLRM